MKLFQRKLIILMSILGFMDSLYLAFEHFSSSPAPCGTGILSGCNAVLESEYAIFLGVPLVVWGLIHYGVLSYVSFLALSSKKIIWKKWLTVQSMIGVLMSAYLVALQLFVIKSICIYCMISAVVSLIIFSIAYFYYKKYLYLLLIELFALVYRKVLKAVFFMFDAELVHDKITDLGQISNRLPFVNSMLSDISSEIKIANLNQELAGIVFETPIGLAAGFDYEAKLTQILPNIGFGFMTVGTITNKPFKGNKKPRLGRLPHSKSLMVNKGFKNLGAKESANKLKNLNFLTPLGISIGVTNNKNITDLNHALEDITTAFGLFEKSNINNKYYELNISCPNLSVEISFYNINNLKLLLEKVDKLKLSKPYFVKMPIEKSDKEFLSMLKVISKSKAKGVIIGNLQKNRNDKSLVQSEVEKFEVGNFSGKPTYKRSNELISLTYKKFKNRFVIIGCGGVFSAEDAYEKIKRGASLVQLITGLIFNGPQLIWQINSRLAELIKEDNFNNISEAVGTYKH